MTVKLIGWAIQRYWVSVSFPTFVAWAIWADWSHTQEWKKQKEMALTDYVNFVSKALARGNPWKLPAVLAPLFGLYIGHLFDESEANRMIRFRDRSALYGRPPPPPGVKEIPSWGL